MLGIYTIINFIVNITWSAESALYMVKYFSIA